MPEAPLRATEGGLVPDGDGWFVLNVRDAAWRTGHFGAFTGLEGEGEARFPQVGINIAVLEPGQPACLLHGEGDQEGFLVLAGECLLLIEGQERPLRAWDYVHCPPWAEHVLVGAGDGPCTVLALGARQHRGVVYPASELARRHGAGADEETRSPAEAYARYPDDVPVRPDPDWLPGS